MDALTRWVSAVPDDVRQDIDYIAPMLQKLGYDSRAYPPSYGQADDFVASNTHNVRQRREYWQKKSQEVQLMTKPPPSYGFRRPETADKTGKEHDEKDNSGIKQGVDDGRDSKETAAGESPPVLNTQTNQNKVSMGSDSADPKQNSDVQKHPVIQHDAKDTEDHSSRWWRFLGLSLGVDRQAVLLAFLITQSLGWQCQGLESLIVKIWHWAGNFSRLF